MSSNWNSFFLSFDEAITSLEDSGLDIYSKLIIFADQFRLILQFLKEKERQENLLVGNLCLSNLQDGLTLFKHRVDGLDQYFAPVIDNLRKMLVDFKSTL